MGGKPLVLDRPLQLPSYTNGLIGGRHGPGTTDSIHRRDRHFAMRVSPMTFA
jgi:hypothetical protein